MHILLENEIEYKTTKEIAPLPGYCYDINVGAWIAEADRKQLLINHPNFITISSKKKDVESGEDQK